MSFFDAPWHIVILLLAALVLFGSSRLPGAAKALGSSMNIFKKAVKEGAEDPDSPGSLGGSTQATVVPPPAQITSTPVIDPKQAQIDELQRQLQDLQRNQAVSDTRPANAQAPEAQPHGQSY
jgi:sec-independent protein translocase protein TatA